MKKAVIILSAIALMGCNNQRKEYNDSDKAEHYSITSFDYSPIWLNYVILSDDDNYINEDREIIYQGIIGDNNQRIQIIFLSIEQSTNDLSIYNVVGKSKVNSNICNFEGHFQVQDVNAGEFKGDPEEYSGEVVGTYQLYENKNEKNSGVFEGNFATKFDVDDSKVSMNKGWYSVNDVNEFIGKWKSYKTNKTKICNWGWIIPPSDNLFRYVENDVYYFNAKYIDSDWKSYVYGHGIPVDNNFDNPNAPNITTVTPEEKEKYRKFENEKWWFQK